VSAIPLVDRPSFARAALLTRLAQLVLAALAAGLATAALLAALGQRAPGQAFLPRDSNGIVVLDVSASISSDTYARIASTLERLSRAGGRTGLVLFSDTAYQALPPGTPVAELRPFERFFTLNRPAQPGIEAQPPRSPWSDAFSAGTRISTGLQLALDVLRRERLHKPAVLLVSDLDDDAGDLESLTSVALGFRRLGVPIRVVGLNPSPEDAQFVERLLPSRGHIVQATLPGERKAGGGATLPAVVVAAAAAFALIAAAFLVVTERLRWQPA
jgi:hypothetical protein